MDMDRFTYIAVAIGIFVAFFLLKRMASGPMVSGEEAKRLVAEGATLVDVRSAGEFASGHIQGAKNIPVQEIGARSNEIPKGKPVVLYCASGMRSGSAAAMLRSSGRTDVHNLGSISRWPG